MVRVLPFVVEPGLLVRCLAGRVAWIVAGHPTHADRPDALRRTGT